MKVCPEKQAVSKQVAAPETALIATNVTDMRRLTTSIGCEVDVHVIVIGVSSRRLIQPAQFGQASLLNVIVDGGNSEITILVLWWDCCERSVNNWILKNTSIFRRVKVKAPSENSRQASCGYELETTDRTTWEETDGHVAPTRFIRIVRS
jgi:hypothetical protein